MLFLLGTATAHSYLNPDNLYRLYEDSKNYTWLITKPFVEFQRIARNRPFEGIDAAYPKVTDGTAASIVQKTPRRVIQQLPTGSVKTDKDNDYLPIVANFILNHKIIPYANEDYGLLEKSQLMIENGLTFGAACSYAPFVNHDGYFCPDLTIPYWGDVFLQRGKKSAQASNYIFVRAWWQTADIDALIDSETKLAAQAKKRGDKYESTWDVQALKKIRKDLSAKDRQALTPDEIDRGISPEGVELVTAFQKGVGAKFYTFHPNETIIVRTKTNKDPRGKFPIDWFYGGIDGNNPLGRGIIELIGGLQNLIDSDMQAYQYNRALALQPPVVKYGNIGDFKFTPNFVVDASNDPTAKIVPLTIDTNALVNYPQLYNLQKSQLLYLATSPDGTISSSTGNPGMSKTSQGVEAGQALLSVDDNAIRKRFETWFRDWCETAINLYFAERTGKEVVQLDSATAKRLRELPNFDQTLLDENNRILINYDIVLPALKYYVDPGTSEVADKAAQVADASNLIDLVMKYPILNKTFGGPIDIDVLARRIVANSGIDDPEQVAPEPTPQEIESKKLQSKQISPFSPFFDKPSVHIDFAQIPPSAQLDLLHNAGSTSVTIQDLLAGPVANINNRGNTALNKPLDDPAQLMPGGQNDQSTTAQAPINLMDIYKKSDDPTVKAQIEARAGLQPNVDHVVNSLNLMPASQQPQPTTGADQVQAQQQQMSQQDMQLMAQLKQLGVSDGGIQQAMDMLNRGANEHQVMQMLAGGQ